MTKAIPIVVIFVCVGLLVFMAHKSGYRDGFVFGRRFVLVVLRHVSPDAADQFRKEIMSRYQYDIFGELDGLDKE